MDLLVTGATGLLGNNVVRRALARGDTVRCLVRRSADPRPLRDVEVDTAEGDVRDRKAVERAVGGCDVVVHAAARVGIGRTDMAGYRDVNVGGTLAVARACRRSGARLVHVSSVDTLPAGTREEPASEDADPDGDAAGSSGPWARLALTVPYMVTKREAEAVVRSETEKGLDAVIVNPAYLLGPWDWKPSSGRMLLAVARGRGLLAPPGGNDFCHAGAVAAAILVAAERGRAGERYILSGEALTYGEAFDLFARVTGAPSPLGVAPAGLVGFIGRLGDLVATVADDEPDMNSASARASCLPHHFSSGKARRELGYEPGTAEEAARDAWAWFRAAGYA